MFVEQCIYIVILPKNFLMKFKLKSVVYATSVLNSKSARLGTIFRPHHCDNFVRNMFSLPGVSIKFEVGSQFEKSRRRY